MNVLVGNNYFYLRGGSERVFFEEMELLEKHGHTVVPFSVADEDALASPFDEDFVAPIDFGREQPLWRKAHVASRILYSFHSRSRAKGLLEKCRPDIAHFHNIHGRLHPAVLGVFKKRGIPTILTLHDFKLLCPTYTMYTGGDVCERCAGGAYWNCLLKRCNKDSFLLSAISAMEGAVHSILGLYRAGVDLLVSPSVFLKEKFIEYGWPREKILHIPNFVRSEEYKPRFTRGDYYLFAGRLSQEKGVGTLIKAFLRFEGPEELRIAGTGPEEQALAKLSAGAANIKFLGFLSGDALEEAIRGSLAMVAPSEGYENASMSILEAQAYGKPVIGSRIGGIPEMIGSEAGVLVTSGDPEEWRSALQAFRKKAPAEIEEMGRNAKKHIDRQHSATRHYRLLMEAYDSLLA